MRACYSAAVTALCAAAAVSCAESNDRTGPTAANAGDTPLEVSAQSGAIVDRTLPVATLLGGGPPTNLALSVGSETSIDDFCADPTAIVFSEVQSIAVFTPSRKVPYHASTHDAFVQVFEYSPGIVTHPCDLVGAPLVASGRVFFSQTFNQLTGPGSGPGSFAVNATVHGIVELTEGGLARLHGSWRFVIRPDGTLVKDQEPVTLKPID
jgi:hypothetical protein